MHQRPGTPAGRRRPRRRLLHGALTYVEEWTKKSFTTADKIAWCMYTSFSGDIRLVNAGLRPLAVVALYGTLNPVETWVRYQRTKDRHIFDGLEESPCRGALSADNPELQRYLDDSVEAFQAYRAGKQTVDETAHTICEHPVLHEWTPPVFNGLTDPDCRAPIGEFTVRTVASFLYWNRYRAPANIRRSHLFPAVVPVALGEATRSAHRHLRQAYDLLQPYTRDYIRLWNNDWKAHAREIGRHL